MEINQYIKIILRWIYFPIIGVLLLGVLAYVNYHNSPVTYTGGMTFTVGNRSVNNPSNFNYDHYYSLSASSEMADTIGSWLTSPNVIDVIYQEAQMQLPAIRISNIGKLILANKSTIGSSVVVATLNGNSHDETARLLSAMGSVVTDQFKSYQSNGSIPGDLTVTPSNPTVIDQPNNPFFSVTLAGFAGLIIGLVLAFFAEAIRPTR